MTSSRVKILSTILLSFIVIAVFGFAGMESMGAGHGNGCLAGILLGEKECFDSGNGVNFLHLTIFKSFSLAIREVAITLIIIFALYVAALRSWQSIRMLIATTAVPWHSRAQEQDIFKIEFNRWVSLFEKRDPLVGVRVHV